MSLPRIKPLLGDRVGEKKEIQPSDAVYWGAMVRGPAVDVNALDRAVESRNGALGEAPPTRSRFSVRLPKPMEGTARPGKIPMHCPPKEA
jgi:hypothetical protein